VHRLAGRRFAGKSLLEWVVRRVTESQQLERVIVLVGDSPQQRQIASLAPPDVLLFVSGEKDPLARFVAAAREEEAEAIVRVRIGNLFVDPALIDRLVTLGKSHPDCDYISYCSSDGRPTVLSKLGVFAEWCRTEALLVADRLARAPRDRCDVTRYIYSRPEQFRLRLVPTPPQLDRDDVRLTIDVEEDWDHALTIYEALGPDSLDWQQIAGLLDEHPAIRQRMARLNRAEAAM
jgi:spore coat polysaccharide biosynthesis protein SpsF (cytidylyltransferase family)